MKIPWPTQHGLIIDAGSTGSRLHLYEWPSRRFKNVPPPISYPLTSNRWTDRLAPGISSFAKNPQDVGQSLSKMVDFARDMLRGKEHQFHSYPIFLKATGGMRQLPTKEREAIINEVRLWMSNKTLCPFYFEKDFARVISGEEEGIYGWVSINFVLGKLLPALQGSGTVDANSSVGSLDLGGASTQIAFFVPDQDILANMFKLQLGGQKHWNVYTHSFLYYGVNSARDRLHQQLAAEAIARGRHTATTPCLPDGYSERLELDGETITIEGGPSKTLDKCTSSTILLLRKDLNSWCNFAHNRQCSFAGVYQPDLPPPGNFGDFYGFGGFKDLWSFLEMSEDKASVQELHDRAQHVCSMTWKELKTFNKRKQKTKQESSTPSLAHYCFVASYTYSLLRDGYGFDLDRNITVVSKVNGLKVGWALGAMLYEINALPWEYVPPSTWVNAFIGSFLLNILFFFLVIFFLRKSHESAAAIIQRKRGLSTPTTYSPAVRARGTSYSTLPNSSLPSTVQDVHNGGAMRERDRLLPPRASGLDSSRERYSSTDGGNL